jgi:hypothetical protein
MFENGFVYLPEQSPWVAQYLAELTTFPNGKHDDQVDSTAQSSTGSRAPPASRAAATDYRALAEELHRQEAINAAPLSASFSPG